MKVPIWPAALALAACGDGGFQVEGVLGAENPADFALQTPRLTATVDGVGSGQFLIDTGAPFTILDTDSFDFDDGVQRIALDAFMVTITDYDVVAYDALPYAMGDDRIDGIIGGDLLSEFALALDYRDERVWLHGDWSGDVPDDLEYLGIEAVAIDVAGGGRYVVPGSCEGGCGTIDVPATRVVVHGVMEGGERFAALVDTGATAVVVSEDLLGRLGDPERPRLDGVTVGTAAGIQSAYFTRIGGVDLDDAAALASVPALVVPGWDLFEAISDEAGEPVDAIIGGSYLRHFVATIDYPGRELVLARYADPSHIDPREYVGPGFDIVRSAGQWRVGDVYPGTDAAARGIDGGELVVELGGQPIVDLDGDGVAAVIAGFDIGEPLPVTIDRLGALVTIDVLVEDLLPEYEGP